MKYIFLYMITFMNVYGGDYKIFYDDCKKQIIINDSASHTAFWECSSNSYSTPNWKAFFDYEITTDYIYIYSFDLLTGTNRSYRILHQLKFNELFSMHDNIYNDLFIFPNEQRGIIALTSDTVRGIFVFDLENEKKLKLLFKVQNPKSLKIEILSNGMYLVQDFEKIHLLSLYGKDYKTITIPNDKVSEITGFTSINDSLVLVNGYDSYLLNIITLQNIKLNKDILQNIKGKAKYDNKLYFYDYEISYEDTFKQFHCNDKTNNFYFLDLNTYSVTDTKLSVDGNIEFASITKDEKLYIYTSTCDRKKKTRKVVYHLYIYDIKSLKKDYYENFDFKKPTMYRLY